MHHADPADTEIAQKLYIATKKCNKAQAKEVKRIGLQTRPNDDIVDYMSESKHVPDSIYEKQNFDNIETIGINLIDSTSACKAMQQMVDICITLVNLFIFLRVELFSKKKSKTKCGITKYIQLLMTYFSTIRSEQLESVIARVDLDVVKIIIEKVSGEDNAAFRNLFSLWLQNLKSEHQYHLNTKDEKTELKAIMLLASIMLINVNESDNQEQKNNDLQKFFNEIIDHSFFSGSMQCLAVLLFGIVDSSVVHDIEECSKSIKNQKTFLNTFLKRKGGINHQSARCLKSLCITVFYQIMAFAFVDKYKNLEEQNKTKMANFASKHPGKVYANIPSVLSHYRNLIFPNFFLDGDKIYKQQKRIQFQRSIGYFVYVKFLVSNSRQKTAKTPPETDHQTTGHDNDSVASSPLESADLANLANKIADLKSTFIDEKSTFTAQIADLQSKSTTLESKFTTLESKITTELASLESAVNKLNPPISKVMPNCSEKELDAIGSPSEERKSRREQRSKILKRRTTSDGCIVPHSVPERSSNGYFPRPKGRPPKGFTWDRCKGVWVPDDFDDKTRTGSGKSEFGNNDVDDSDRPFKRSKSSEQAEAADKENADHAVDDSDKHSLLMQSTEDDTEDDAVVTYSLPVSVAGHVLEEREAPASVAFIKTIPTSSVNEDAVNLVMDQLEKELQSLGDDSVERVHVLLKKLHALDVSCSQINPSLVKPLRKLRKHPALGILVKSLIQKIRSNFFVALIGDWKFAVESGDADTAVDKVKEFHLNTVVSSLMKGMSEEQIQNHNLGPLLEETSRLFLEKSVKCDELAYIESLLEGHGPGELEESLIV